MRVLHFIPSLGGGGAERQVSYLAEGLCRRGVDVHVATLRGGVYLSRVLGAGATAHHLPARGNYDPRLLPRALGVVDAVRPDVVQTWLTQQDIIGGLAALMRRVPWVLSERSAPQSYRGGWKNVLRRSLGRFADAIVANSAAGLAYWSPSPARKYVVPNAVDREALDAATPATLDVADGQAVVLVVGRLERAKNLDTLVPALCNVVRTRDAVAVVCGQGPGEAAMRAQIEQQGCSDRFRLLGFTDAVWQFMKRADVLVAVSWLEGAPNAVIEAAVAGCPLVVGDTPQHRAFLDERSATLVPPLDVAAITRAVEAVLDDREAAREKAQRARAAVEGWSIERAAAEYLQIYEELVF